MALTMNEKSMDVELQKLLHENEKLKARAWACILTSTPKLLSYSTNDKRVKIGASTIYCYVGLSDTFLHLVTLNSLDVTKVTGNFRIPLEDIKQTTIKNGLLKSSATIDFGKEKIKILWVNQAAGTDMKNQRKNVKIICDSLRKI